MERSGSQKFLRVIAIINIVIAIATILGGIFLIAAGGFYAMSPDATSIDGLSAAEAGAGVSFGGIVAIVEGIVELVMGILGLRASNDASKVMPVWVISLISLAIACLSAVMNLVGGNINASSIGDIIGSLAGSGLMFWVANNIKKQEGR